MAKKATLTKSDREAIINAVIADVPSEFRNHSKFVGRLQAVVDKGIASEAPEGIAAAWGNPHMRKYLNWHGQNLGNILGHGWLTSNFYSGGKEHQRGVSVDILNNLKLPEAAMTELLAIKAAFDAEQTSIQEMRAKLTSAMAGLKTSKAFLALYPELEKYLPDAPAVEHLPAVIDVVADLARMGWPEKKVLEAA